MLTCIMFEYCFQAVLIVAFIPVSCPIDCHCKCINVNMIFVLFLELKDENENYFVLCHNLI